MSDRSEKIIVLLDGLATDGLLSPGDLKKAQQKKGESLERFLEEAGVSQTELNNRLAKNSNLSSISLSSYSPDPEVLKLISKDQAHEWQVFPLFQTEDILSIAMFDPFDQQALDQIKVELGLEIEAVLVTKEELLKTIVENYGHASIKSQKNKSVRKTGGKSTAKPHASKQVVELVDGVFIDAHKEGASDIHFEPTREGLVIRLRVDGALEEYGLHPESMKEAILSRIKIIGEMDVAEHRRQLDGRATIVLDGQNLDLRIATYPTMFGEAAAIRMHTKENVLSLTEIGFSEHDQKIFEQIIHQPHGIFLTTGPTGSGKTTTLYAALQGIDRKTNHVLSVEDPIENEIEGVDQTQINEKAGVTFASTLRAMLRQDPDIIMVGEIRDKETAEIALSAAMTGHLVFSTLHTNSAIAAIARLADLGVDPFLVSSTVLGVLAQRLVRKICPNCEIEEIPISPEVSAALGQRASMLKNYRGKGCSKCNNRGFKGRLGLFELFHVDSDIRVLMANNSPEVRLKEKAVTTGFKSLFEDGIKKSQEKLTSLDEVVRVCGDI